jgi:hypothetical protein
MSGLDVALPDLDRTGAEDRVDSASLVAEFSQVRARQDRVGVRETLGGRRRSTH